MQATRYDHRILHDIQANRAFGVLVRTEISKHVFHESTVQVRRVFALRELLDHGVDVDDAVARGELRAFTVST